MKSTAIAIVIAGALIGGAILYSGTSSLSDTDPAAQANNVSVVDGKQLVTIAAKGGYSPRASVAKAGVPTTLRVQTKGTFDCSSALSIPALQYRTYLPATGATDIEIPPQPAGTTLRGLCAMGMYTFTIAFN